jgi:hypothetical protein
MVRREPEPRPTLTATPTGSVVNFEPVTPEQVANAAHAIATAQLAVEQLYDAERYKREPSLRTMTLRILAADLGEARRQLLEAFSE